MSATHELIKTPFGFESTAAEVAEGIDLTGKRAIVTGASSGIGVETARVLAAAGAGVTLAVRNREAGQRVAADITAATGNADVVVAELDLARRETIAAFVAAWEEPLHLLVNNAGVMAIQELELSPEGYELQFATNHLGHFALTLGLHDALAADGNARIVSVSSAGHLRSPVIFEDINFDFRPYEPFLAYGQSKTANILLAVEATRRWAGDGITANALMPGGIETNLQRHSMRSTWSAPGRSLAGGSASSRSSRGRRPVCCSRPHPSSRASAAATSRTATRPRRCVSGARTAPPPGASPGMRWTRGSQSGCGMCRWR